MTALHRPETPKCVNCHKEIKWMRVEGDEEVYKCECGLSDERRPVIK